MSKYQALRLMNQENQEPGIVETLASNEEHIASLYHAYASAFPVLKEFWNSLAAEEIKHASWIRSLGSASKDGRVFIDKGRFNTTAVQSYMDYLDKELARIKKQSIPLIEALSITFYIEESLIESRFFEVFETDCAEIKNVFLKLAMDTKQHRNKAKEELIKVKKQGHL